MKNKYIKIVLSALFMMLYFVISASADDTDLVVDANSIKNRSQTATAITDAYGVDILTDEYTLIKEGIISFKQKTINDLSNSLFINTTDEKSDYEHIVSLTNELNMFSKVNDNSFKQDDIDNNNTVSIILYIFLFVLLGILGYALARKNLIKGKLRR